MPVICTECGRGRDFLHIDCARCVRAWVNQLVAIAIIRQLMA